MTEPSDSPTVNFHDNTLATSFSVKLPIGDLIWLKDAGSLLGTPVVEGLKFTHVRLYDTPALRTIQHDRFHIAVIQSKLGIKGAVSRGILLF